MKLHELFGISSLYWTPQVCRNLQCKPCPNDASAVGRPLHISFLRCYEDLEASELVERAQELAREIRVAFPDRVSAAPPVVGGILDPFHTIQEFDRHPRTSFGEILKLLKNLDL